jgi:hypothetical protein
MFCSILALVAEVSRPSTMMASIASYHDRTGHAGITVPEWRVSHSIPLPKHPWLRFVFPQAELRACSYQWDKSRDKETLHSRAVLGQRSTRAQLGMLAISAASLPPSRALFSEARH